MPPEVHLGRAVGRAVVVGQVEVGDAEVERRGARSRAASRTGSRRRSCARGRATAREVEAAATDAAVLHAVVAVGCGGVRHVPMLSGGPRQLGPDHLAVAGDHVDAPGRGDASTSSDHGRAPRKLVAAAPGCRRRCRRRRCAAATGQADPDDALRLRMHDRVGRRARWSPAARRRGGRRDPTRSSRSATNRRAARTLDGSWGSDSSACWPGSRPTDSRSSTSSSMSASLGTKPSTRCLMPSSARAGEDDHLGARGGRPDAAEHLAAGEVGQAQVEDDHVGLVVGCVLDRLGAVAASATTSKPPGSAVRCGPGDGRARRRRPGGHGSARPQPSDLRRPRRLTGRVPPEGWSGRMTRPALGRTGGA